MNAARWFPIETPRLLLREFTDADERDVHEYASDPLVPRLMDWDTNTAETTRIVLAQNIAAQSEWPRDEVNLAVELRAERKVIGSIRLAVIDGDNGNADFGFVFNRRYWNNGYATEAARAILDVAFSVLRLHRVIATCDVRNGASSRVMEKLAMRREGHFLQDRMQKGEWRDSYLYGILAHEWRLLVHNRTID